MDADVLKVSKQKRAHPVSDDEGDETPKKPVASSTPPSKPPRKAPQKKRNPPFFYPDDEEEQQAFVEKYKSPKIEEDASTETIANLLEPYDNSPLAAGGPLPPGWKIVRPADAKHAKTVCGFSSDQLYGEKREKDESNQDYVERNKGLRGSGFHIARDEAGRDRWLLRLRDFAQFAVGAQRKSMEEDPKLDLYIEKPGSWLVHVGEFVARTYNWDSSEFFPTFFGLVPTSLLLHKIKLSKAKKQSTEQKKKQEKEKTTDDAGADGTPAADAKGKTTDLAVIKLYDESTLSSLFAKLKEDKEKLERMLESSAKSLEAMPVGDEEARNLFASMWKFVYNDGKASDGSFDEKTKQDNTKKRRDLFGKKLEEFGTSEQKNAFQRLFCDAMAVNGEWKKKVEEKGGVMGKYVPELLKTPEGQLLWHVFFAASEAAGKESQSARRPMGEAELRMVEGFKRNIEGFVAHLKEIQSDMKKADANNVETFSRLTAQVDDLQQKLETARAKNAKLLEKKQQQQESPKKAKKAKKEEPPVKKEEPAKKKAKEQNGKKKKEEESSSEEEGEGDSDSSEEDVPAPPPPKKQQQKVVPPKAILTTPPPSAAAAAPKKVEDDEEDYS